MRALAAAVAAAALVAATSLVGAQPETRSSASAPKPGTIHFPNSGSPAAQEPFLRGVALLHGAEYRDARIAFQEAENLDPAFALAYWLEAFSHSEFESGAHDLPAAHAVLARLASTPAERVARAGTPRERAFGAAVEAFLDDGGTRFERARAFAAAMRDWSADAPADIEAAAFAALGSLFVLRDAPPAERIQRAEDAIRFAAKVAAVDPEHPVGAHYLIHATDSPRFAAKGLAAARIYDKIAPATEHALHVPSHIYLQLGMWADVSASNERAWDGSRAPADGGQLPEPGWHSLQWLHYSYMQEGRYREARALVDAASRILAQASPEPPAGNADARYIVETMAFQYGAESGDWSHAAGTAADAAALAARAVAAPSPREQQQAMAAAYHVVAAAAGRKDLVAAGGGVRAMRATVAVLPRGEPRRTQAETLTAQLDALIARARGDHAAAIEQLTRLAVAAPDADVLPVGPPSTLSTVELLAGALFDAGRFDEAAVAYERGLAERPNRSSALLGLARAKNASRDPGGAFAAYSKLLANWRRADQDLPALAEARRR